MAKLTPDILENMVKDVLLEYTAEHCKGKPIKEKIACEKADNESRARSAAKRQKKEMYGTIPTDIERLQKAILEGEGDTQPGSDKIVLDKAAFDILMKRLATEYENHLSNELTLEEQEGNEKKAKIKALCNRYGLKSFRSFLNIINAFELAQKGGLYKDKK